MAGNWRHHDPDQAVLELAERQYGVVARSQLLGLGFGERKIEGWLRRGRLHRLHRGVYALGRKRVDRPGLWLAAVLAYGNGAVLSHLSAAAAWGFAGGRFSPVHVTAPRSHLSRPGIRLHEGKLASDEITECGEIPITTVARTLFDLAEATDERRLERMWEEADRLRLLRLREVERVCEQNPGRRALHPTRRLLAEVSAPITTRSPLEDRFLAFCRERALPPPATNVLVLGHETDAYWPAARLVVELDGYAFHRHRAAFERDGARIAALQAAGYRAIRVTHHRIERDGDNLAREIRALLGLA